MTILDRFRLDGRVVVVTGASSGLGVAIARACAEAGADVVIAARRTSRLADTAELIRATGRRALLVTCDVSNHNDCVALVDSAIAELGKVDVLVNNAGTGTAIPALREPPDEFRAIIETNLNGSFWAAQACARVMPRGSSIVNIASVLADKSAGLPQAAYTASKAGLVGLTRDLAQQWGDRRGIRVNAVAPGFFMTEMTAHYPDGYLESLLPRIVLRRVGDPDELAAAVVWLASDAASYVTGQTVTVDGGFTIN